MLELQHIKKYFTVGDTTTKALDDVSVAFRSQEFVSILGPSGSGKTTMLNIIGGLDKYDSGDLIIDGKSTKTFADDDWDAYRNNTVGFIFQNYNIINHLSILDNVSLGMTLSGVSTSEKKQRAQEALERVGLKEHISKKPSQLSGGQLQRVAIARALANDPQILLADEPTGALDTQTSNEIMQLIKDLSKERLVVMVTHNPDLAHQYSDRIIEFSDGKIQNDSRPYQERDDETHFQLVRTKMSFWTALKLSFTNIKTKKGRTFLTILASSIGIISIGIVLALSNGFQKQIDATQAETLSQFPITISQVTADQKQMQKTDSTATNSQQNFAHNTKLTAKANQLTAAQHLNKITPKYLKYVQKIKKSDSKNIAYTYTTGLNLIRKVDSQYRPVSFATTTSSSSESSSAQSMFTSNLGVGGSVYPVDRNNQQSFLKKNYHVLAGSYPKNNHEVVFITDKQNNLNLDALKNLGFNFKDQQKITPKQLLNTNIKVVANNNYYQQLPTGNFVPSKNYNQMGSAASTINLKIVGILRTKSKNSDGLLSSGVAYSDRLTKEVIQENKNSKIALTQKQSTNNVITGSPLKGMEGALTLTALGATKMPNSIQIYPNNFKEKNKITDYLDKYNKHKSKANKIIYVDLAGNITSITGGLMDAITYVLVGFAAISLVTSMIMIAIITYTSVIERTKEIGVLRALGARKKDITRVFDAETTILGVGSGILGVIIAWLLTIPANVILANLTGLSHVAKLNPLHAIILIIVSTILTVLGGHIPARIASKKDAATALRSE
ncbi:ABC transporter ATP-binding protein/permease [Bombilactobacillus folatiphilus]|uniref:ABC transporter ATP-binding protein/permease n=1 Tax=Bombilactobacillus folatiphilus TaxID=2923362 RepID=A0ABY4P963_9LACO|nr:ABC transporter ATP-binding protein/permease [Bombilactobacillus folatiphilus]UQS82151.1 ABC transporter ATP-binding protein/permease [Bombilactobacillus folatiphilus]